MNKNQKKKRPFGHDESALGKAFRFNQADLQDNQSGFISLKQKRRLIGVMIISSVLIVVFVIMMIIGLVNSWVNVNTSWGIMLCGIVTFLAVGVIAGLIAVSSLRWRQILTDVRMNHVQMLEGIIHLNDVQRSNGKKDYLLRIDDDTFAIKEEQQRVFTSDTTYRLYIAPESRTILSVEKIQPSTGNTPEAMM